MIHSTGNMGSGNSGSGQKKLIIQIIILAILMAVLLELLISLSKAKDIEEEEARSTVAACADLEVNYKKLLEDYRQLEYVASQCITEKSLNENLKEYVGERCKAPDQLVRKEAPSEKISGELEWGGKAVPYFRGESSIGVRLYRLDQDGKASALGLKEKDLVLSINGQLVADPATFGSYMRDLDPGSDFQIKVYRNRKELIVTGK